MICISTLVWRRLCCMEQEKTRGLQVEMGVRASKLSRIPRWRLIPRGPGKPRPLAPKGYVPVWVGVGGESKRFMIHTTSFGDAQLLDLLCKSAEEYGYRNDGVLRIPYDAKRFEERVLMGRDGRRTLKVITA